MDDRIKLLFARMFWPVGSVRTIFWGPCRGLKYHIFPEYGLSPLYGGWESAAQHLMVEHIQSGSVAYDIGANYGIHTLLMARLVGNQGHVYAFEPLPEIATYLQEQVALNHLANVTCVRSALGDSVGTTGFSTGHHHGAGHVAQSETGSLTVEISTLDEFVMHQNNRPPDFIKCDVEGFEGRVLAGGKITLSRYRPVCLIDLHSPEQDRVVGSIFSELGYDVFRTEDGSKVSDLSRGWPTPDGIWGQIIAFPESKNKEKITK